LIAIAAAAYAAIFLLATFVEPTPHEITVRVPTDKLLQE
jgi:hypothetical protein